MGPNQAMIVHESLYGTNRALAQAIAHGMGASYTVVVVEAHAAPSIVPVDLDLLVVGGPNHKTALPTPETRAEAVAEGTGELRVCDRGLREWLDDLEVDRRGQRVAVWDTRMASPRVLARMDRGSRMIAKRLRRAGCRLVAEPEHFSSSDGVGGLVDGELERACAWGEQLGRLTTEWADGKGG